MSSPKFQNFKDFYKFYLTEHLNPINRLLHFFGTTLALCLFIYATLTSQTLYFLYGIFSGYFCAWVGHFLFEKNKPASFKQPIFSFIGDWCMWFQLLTGQTKFNSENKN